MESRLAFILFGHGASSFPLIKRLCKNGYKVDVYIICTGNLHYIEGFNEVNINTEHSLITYLSRELLQEVYDYVDSENLKCFSVSFPETYDKYPFVQLCISPYLQYQYFKFCRAINKNNYDLVNIVTRVSVSSNCYLLSNIKAKRIILSLHEVYNHTNSGNSIKIPKIYKIAKHKDIDIVVFSRNSYNDIKNFGDKSLKVSIIYFGLFETYASIKPADLDEMPDDYILIIGAIKPYKGLGVLYDAVQKCYKNGTKVNVVIAGYGDDPILVKMRKAAHYTIYNKYLSSAEFVSLVKNCKYVVCPYLTMSQSGIPQTAFLFNKPIIASDLEGFKEIIEDKKNGLLFPVNNSNGLCEAISIMESDSNYYNIKKEVKSFTSSYPCYDWTEITSTFITKFIS